MQPSVADGNTAIDGEAGTTLVKMTATAELIGEVFVFGFLIVVLICTGLSIAAKEPKVDVSRFRVSALW